MDNFKFSPNGTEIEIKVFVPRKNDAVIAPYNSVEMISEYTPTLIKLIDEHIERLAHTIAGSTLLGQAFQKGEFIYYTTNGKIYNCLPVDEINFFKFIQEDLAKGKELVDSQRRALASTLIGIELPRVKSDYSWRNVTNYLLGR